MTYSIDLRKRVVKFVHRGGSKAEASKRYEVSLWCVNDWCKRNDLTPKSSKRRKRKLDWEALLRHLQEFLDALLRERAQHFGVRESAIWYANHQMKLTRKKRCDPASPTQRTCPHVRLARRISQGNAHQDKTLKYSERKHTLRIIFLKSLRQIIIQQSSQDLVYIDESGFDAYTYRPYAWSKRGQKCHGERKW